MSTPALQQSPAYVRLISFISTQWALNALRAATHYQFAEIIAQSGGRADTAFIAQQTGTSEKWVYAVLLILAQVGIFEEIDKDAHLFTNTDISEYLLPENYHNQIAMSLYFLSPASLQRWSNLEECMKFDSPAAELLYGKDLYTYLGEVKPEERDLLDRSLVSFSRTVDQPMVNAYTFDGIVCDIGGGYGSLLQAIIDKYPNVQGILFELPEIVEALQKRSSTYSFQLIAGNVFNHSSLPFADTYVLKQVWHNWPDDQCVEMLRSCYQVNKYATVLICEQEIYSGNGFPEWLNLLMLLEHGGKERSRKDFQCIVESAGYFLKEVISTHSPNFIYVCQAK